ncbi:MAG: ABC transporter ATP-binding protein [Eubacteriaceae bacterium]|nr:ABC transporter ATP-binding protein [Eubacteriaceae bacterium]
MIQVKNLTKIYRLNKKEMNKQNTREKSKIAVDDISFEAKENRIFGLLGPNGAGKTTALRCIATLIKPTSGSITVNGYDTIDHSLEVRREICFLTNELKLDTHFTPKYTMEFFGKLYSMEPGNIYRRTKELFTRFAIEDFKNTPIGELSTGMKQKLSIAVSLIHDPKVIIFDEPTNGLDIITAKSVTDYLLEMKAAGKTVIISTHIMSVAEKLCDEAAILLDGKISASGTIAEICKENGESNLEDAFYKLYFAENEGRRT